MKFAGKDEQPLVSVCIITYNHEKWISAAIESVLMQKTDFPCELIIAEDCSKDDTRAILLSYAEKYPIRLILQEKNVGPAQNWKALMHAPTGKYVAYFEGDDSWTDPLKLEKQVAILEKNKEVVLCYANAGIFDTKNPDMKIYFQESNKPPTFQDRYQSVRMCPMPTCTVFFRNLLKPLPDWALKVHAGDYIMVALLCKYGGIYYQDEVVALHNHHYLGASRATALETFYFNDAPLLQNLNSYYNNDPRIFEAVMERNIGTIDKLFHMKQFKKARQLYRQLPFKEMYKQKVFLKEVAKQGIKIHLLPFLSKGKTYR